MKIFCKNPKEIIEIDSLEKIEYSVEHEGLKIARYVFNQADRLASFTFQPRIFPSNLKIKTGKKLEPIPSVELSYSTDVVVMGRNGLVKIMGDEAIAFLHPFYTIDRLFDPLEWNSVYVRRMQLRLSNLSVVSAGELALLRPINIRRTIEEPVFVFGTPADENYSHYIWDSLPQLWYLQQLRHIEIKILVDEKLADYKKDFLLALGFDESRIIWRNTKEHILCKKIYMGSRLAVNNRMIVPQGLELLNQLRLPKTKQSRRIFLDRDDDRKETRQLLNEEDLWTICQDFGFERLTPGHMSLSEKQKAFSEAEIIVGQYGGGLQNHYLCHPNTRLIILQSDLFQRNIFDYTSGMLQLPIISIFGRAFPKGLGNHNNSNFMIDERIFRQVLKQMLKPTYPWFLKLLTSNKFTLKDPEDLQLHRLQIRKFFHLARHYFGKIFKTQKLTKSST